MNSRDTSDEGMHAAFRARLDAAPEAPDAVFARTMAAIGRETSEPAVRAPGWQNAARWWSALAAPARFATAAAIVIVGGTIAFGTVRATHERIVAADSLPATRITLDKDGGHVARIARSASMQLAVRDIASSVRRIAALAKHGRGEIVAQNVLTTKPAAHATMRLLLRVPAGSLDATMRAVASFGTLETHRTKTADLSGQLDVAAARLRRAQDAARTLRAAPSAGDAVRLAALEAEIARLRARRTILEQRVATATLAIVLRSADSDRTALGAIPDEPSQNVLRPTSILLARGSSLASHRPQFARRRLRSLDLAAFRALADRPRAGRAATGRNDDPDRV